MALFLSTGTQKNGIAQDCPTSGSLAYFIYSPAYATRCPSVHASATCSNLSHGIPDAPTPDLLAPRGTLPVNVLRRDIASARARLSLSTQVAQRPNFGVQVGTRGRSERLPGLPNPFRDVTFFSRWLLLADPHCCVCSLPPRTVFSHSLQWLTCTLVRGLSH